MPSLSLVYLGVKPTSALALAEEEEEKAATEDLALAEARRDRQRTDMIAFAAVVLLNKCAGLGREKWTVHC